MEKTVNEFFGDEKVQQTLRLHYQELLTSNRLPDLNAFEKAVVDGVAALENLGLNNPKTIAFLVNTKTADQIRALFSYPERAEAVVRERIRERGASWTTRQAIVDKERRKLDNRRAERADDRADQASLAVYNAFGAIQTGARTAWRLSPLGAYLLAGIVFAHHFEPASQPFDPYNGTGWPEPVIDPFGATPPVAGGPPVASLQLPAPAPTASSIFWGFLADAARVS